MCIRDRIKDVLIDATVLTAEGELKTVTRDELDLSYRHSLVPVSYTHLDVYKRQILSLSHVRTVHIRFSMASSRRQTRGTDNFSLYLIQYLESAVDFDRTFSYNKVKLHTLYICLLYTSL